MTARVCKICGRAAAPVTGDECGEGLLCEGRRRCSVARAAGYEKIGLWGQVLFRAGVVEHRVTDPHYRRTGIRLEPEPWVPAWAHAVAELGKKFVKREIAQAPVARGTWWNKDRTWTPAPKKIYEVPISARRRAELIHRIAFGVGTSRSEALGEAAARARTEATMTAIARAVDWRAPWDGWPSPRPPSEATHEAERDGVIFASDTGTLFSPRQIPLVKP